MIGGGQIAVSPRGRSTFESSAWIGQNDKRWHVLVFGSQSISDPTADTGIAHQDAARVHLIDGLRMVHAVAVHRTDHTKIVGMLRHMWEEITDLQTRLASRSKATDWSEQRILLDVATRHHVAKAFRQWLATVLRQRGFRIKQIHVTGATVHEKPNHSFGTRGKMRLMNVCT
ncbi:hypothetical protein RB13128 [Rhodopirellula baltica SH 1]|uniref:Uncharacterized protein n=1 Tax=Rhodopirellula baltica (strain DSM 10527 / NCIMB 13988 / SH1) TaxID=243090 RepID=Q7UHL0_RHOBA|nr:hypothetical protein RB13128 [Rhodopirellula baltica SH 1]